MVRCPRGSVYRVKSGLPARPAASPSAGAAVPAATRTPSRVEPGGKS